ncbi:MAG: ABC transporter ATP-binding protein [Clostridiales bacterium]|nr:ABC transporter ATP-binding protein [Clostridiales bacterium]
MSDIKLEGLCFKYDDSDYILDNLNLEIKEGEFVCFIGPSGCGKSTLLTLIEGLNKPTKGSVLIDGVPVTGPGGDRCVVFQHYSLFSWQTSKKNITFGVKQAKKGISSKEADAIALNYLAKVGLAEYANKYPHQLSGGMQQRVAIARALAMDPDILLMDEPFGAIDAKNRMQLQDLVLELCENEEKKRTVVFITHDVEEALYLADRVIYMEPKRIKEEIPIDFGSGRVRANLFGAPRFLQLRNHLITLFYDNADENMGSEPVYL